MLCSLHMLFKVFHNNLFHCPMRTKSGNSKFHYFSAHNESITFLLFLITSEVIDMW